MKCASATCPNDFTPKSGSHRYCSRRCAHREYGASLYGGGVGPLAERTCAYAKCRAPFTPRIRPQRFCSTKCGVGAYNALPRAEKASRRSTKVQRHPNTELIHELRQEVGPMRCIYCEARLTSVKAYICEDRECRSSYHRDYAAIRRKRAKEARPPLAERLCACGCGTSFTPTVAGQLYADPKHTRKHLQRKWNAERSAIRKEARESGQTARNITFRAGRGKGILFARGVRLPGREYAAG